MYRIKKEQTYANAAAIGHGIITADDSPRK